MCYVICLIFHPILNPIGLFFFIKFLILTIRSTKLINRLFKQIMKFLCPFQSFFPRAIRAIWTHLSVNMFPPAWSEPVSGIAQKQKTNIWRVNKRKKRTHKKQKQYKRCFLGKTSNNRRCCLKEESRRGDLYNVYFGINQV